MNSEFRLSLPVVIQEILQNSPGTPITQGESGAEVWHFPQVNAYLKLNEHHTAYPVRQEAERLRWLAGKLPVADVLIYAEDTQRQYLLMSAIPGLHPMHDDLNWSAAERITFLAAAARRFHALDAAECQHARSIDTLLAEAADHIERGWVREDLFEDQYQGMEPYKLFERLLALRPADEPMLVTHGDLFPMNIHADPVTHALNGFLDVGSCALADPYIDLAVIALAIEWHLGKEWVQPFFAAYGIAAIDEQRLQFFQLLNEFF